jgi:CRISPR/Cas system-associated endonuclease Cas1
MAAWQKLSQVSSSSESPVSKSGVLTIHGFGVRLRMQAGHLEVEDGIGPDRRRFRLARIGHGLKRLVCIAEDGFATLDALTWITNVGASFVMLDRDGHPNFVSGPASSVDARLRRAQALALSNAVGLEICKTIIDSKLEGQERLSRGALANTGASGEIAALRYRIATADTFDALRVLEAHAAVAYFAAWRNIPVQWPKADLPRIPDHWHTVGSRHSPLSGGPRLAVTPVHAILNFCLALLETETRLALSALGLDPCLGLGLHKDAPNRDSLVFDVLEPVRPRIEEWVLDWIRSEPFRRADFGELPNGNCRIASRLCTKLSETAPTWGQLVAPWAEYAARRLWASTNPAKSERRLATPLTQQHRRIAKNRPEFAEVKVPRFERVCRGCGTKIPSSSNHCGKCNIQNATERIVEISRAGRIAGHSPEAIAKEAATHRRLRKAQRDWKATDQPDWLTERFFRDEVQPRLSQLSGTAIANQIGVSRWYGSRIRDGYVPHPRHWKPLTKLAGLRANREGVEKAV